LLWVLLLCLVAPAAVQAQIVRGDGWTDGSVNLNDGWRVHTGDHADWAMPGLDDSDWALTSLTDESNRTGGWRWYRLRVQLSAERAQLALLTEGGYGTYEVYVNGQKMPGPALRPPLFLTFPKEQAIALPALSGTAEIALRTFVPDTSMFLDNRGAFRVRLGTVPAIDEAARAAQSTRQNHVSVDIGVHLILLLAGLVLLALFGLQRDHPEYLWLGLYLAIDALGSAVFVLASTGYLPFSINWFFCEPAVYLATIAQIEFTFCFVGQRVTKIWRVYEAALLIPPVFLLLPAWFGYISRGLFNVGEILLILPAAVMLPVLLLVWARRGLREARWLILPSLLPNLASALNDVGIVSAYLGWKRGVELGSSFKVGPLAVMPFDVADLVFMLAIGFVMFFRFTRVSQEQAHSAAELEAAHRVQALLLQTPHNDASAVRIEAVYRPAQEVGGDFFHTAQMTSGVTRVVVGDVSGKGLGAAMLVSAVVGALDTMGDGEPATVLLTLNGLLLARQQGGFATCICASIAGDGAITMANAGHLAPYRNGVEMPCDSGLPLGLTEDVDYVETALRLEPGDALTFLSDGVVEARSTTGELFGFDRTRAVSGRSAESIAEAAQQFGQEDDITVLTLAFAPVSVAPAV
jgi:hypothetical protein